MTSQKKKEAQPTMEEQPEYNDDEEEDEVDKKVDPRKSSSQWADDEGEEDEADNLDDESYAARMANKSNAHQKPAKAKGTRTTTKASSKGNLDVAAGGAVVDMQSREVEEHIPKNSISGQVGQSSKKKGHDYAAWKAKQQERKDKHQQRMAESFTRPTVKAERAIKTREADMKYGIVDALRQVAMKKKEKQMKKKMKKDKRKKLEEEGEEEEDEDSDENGEEADVDQEFAEENDENTKGKHKNDEDDDGMALKIGDEKDDSAEVDEIEDDDADDSAASSSSSNSAAKVAAFRASHSIFFHCSRDEDSDPLYFPIRRFQQLTEDYVVDSKLVAATLHGFHRPTAIQSQSWPILLSGKAMIGISQTGSGKTLAFMIPAYQHILRLRNKTKDETKTSSAASTSSSASTSSNSTVPLATPTVLVLSPTRELALQTHEVTKNRLNDSLGFHIVSRVIYGGPDLENQAAILQVAVDIVVATPGRLLKLLERGAIHLSQVSYFVLDEADRMLDLGFQEDILRIISFLPSSSSRQTLLFSATWPPRVEEISKKVLPSANNVLRISVGQSLEEHRLHASKQVTQFIEIIHRIGGQRERRLVELLHSYYSVEKKNLILIFTLYKKESNALTEYLVKKGFPAVALNGDQSQAARKSAIERFRSGQMPILVATDVAARGLDIPNISHVFNFSVGLSVEQYVHRIGRTGRGSAVGIALTFFVPEWDLIHAPKLIEVLNESGQKIPPELFEMKARALNKLGKMKYNDEEEGDDGRRHAAAHGKMKQTQPKHQQARKKNDNRLDDVSDDDEDDDVGNDDGGEETGAGTAGDGDDGFFRTVEFKAKKPHATQLKKGRGRLANPKKGGKK